MSDKIDRPKHYDIGNTGLQAIDIIDALRWGVPFSLGSAVKYLIRGDRKDGEPILDDLKKARWYLDHAISILEKT